MTATRADVLTRIALRLARTPGCEVPAWLTATLADTAPDDDQSVLSSLTWPAGALVHATGLIEADIRFGALFASLQQPLAARRPCVGLLSWLLAGPEASAAELTRECHRLVRRGLLIVDNPADPRSEWVLRIPVPVWDLLVGNHIDPDSLPPQVELLRRDEFPCLEQLALADSVFPIVARLPELLADGDRTAVVMRGMLGSGRTTVLGSVARALGWDVLRFSGKPGDDAWQIFSALTSIAEVLPVVRTESGPGDSVTLPALPHHNGPVGVTTGRTGGVRGALVERAVTVTLQPCGPTDRRLLWARCGFTNQNAELDRIAERFLLAPGNILRAAPLAVLAAHADGRDRVTTDDVRSATQSLRRDELDALATRLEPLNLDNSPMLAPFATEELDTLIARCRHRETLLGGQDATRTSLNRGVRALFSGPSGTGKTLTARYLAAVLELDLYRIDLAAVVNKYIGETERNLDKVLSRAEELDVLLLLDEGDALMTRRTEVGNANDRYANLETNFLLQRLETFEGIVVVTSNAASRIDPAFLRRIDVTVDFVPPDAEQRLMLWFDHLPAQHVVDLQVLDEVARRCALTGGQIRNAALHAILLSVNRGSAVTTDDVVSAVRREYRRTGATCPLAAPRSGPAAAVTPACSVPSW